MFKKIIETKNIFKIRKTDILNCNDSIDQRFVINKYTKSYYDKKNEIKIK